MFETETDLITHSTFGPGYFAARQPDSERFRLWEVAGTSHADTYSLLVGITDFGDSPDAAELVVTCRDSHAARRSTPGRSTSC